MTLKVKCSVRVGRGKEVDVEHTGAFYFQGGAGRPGWGLPWGWILGFGNGELGNPKTIKNRRKTMPRGSNLAGKPGPGRPKGLQNKVTSDLKGMILTALSQVGGPAWLEKIAMEQPGHFVKLLSMLVPREISHSGVITGVTVQINSNIALGPGRAFKQIETQMQQEDIISQIPHKVEGEVADDTGD